MATLSDSKIIDRESTNKGLADRYLSGQAAGGAYQPVQKNVKTGNGTNELSVGVSDLDIKYTAEKGFKLKSTTGTENFNEKALNYSDGINGGVKTIGSNKISTNWNGELAIQDAMYTIDQGFKLRSPLGQTQFKDASGNQSKQMSLYLKGFNSDRYSNGKFTR